MESVAKSVQGPIKILFVSAWADPTTDPPTKLKTSLLGLGDIVVPGEYVRLDWLRTQYGLRRASACLRSAKRCAGFVNEGVANAT